MEPSERERILGFRARADLLLRASALALVAAAAFAIYSIWRDPYHRLGGGETAAFLVAILMFDLTRILKCPFCGKRGASATRDSCARCGNPLRLEPLEGTGEYLKKIAFVVVVAYFGARLVGLGYVSQLGNDLAQTNEQLRESTRRRSLDALLSAKVPLSTKEEYVSTMLKYSYGKPTLNECLASLKSKPAGELTADDRRLIEFINAKLND